MRAKLLAALVLVLALPALAQEIPGPKENAWLRTWIEHRCCVTNNCCFRIKPKDITPLGNDRYRINASRQELARTDWSRDGEIWRCACEQVDGKWTVFPTANTRCLYPTVEAAVLIECVIGGDCSLASGVGL
jgi:hypothetical protein